MKLQENRANTANIDETVADIIVAKMRSRFRKTGKKANSYDEFLIERIAEEVGGREAYFEVSTWGVAQALNSVKGINARYDNTSFQIGPCEYLEQIHIERDQQPPPQVPARRFWRCGGYGLKRFDSLRAQNKKKEKFQ